MILDKWHITSFSNDLSKYLELIETHNVRELDASNLYGLYGQLQNEGNTLVDVDNVFLNVNTKIGGTHPSDVSKIVIRLQHKCEFDAAKDPLSQDPIKEYKFYVEIKGYGPGTNWYMNCWRLDRHPEKDNHKFTHPYFHFHAGGDELVVANCDPGNLIMLTSPRLPHPPMDLFLGLHFLMSNFLSVKDYDSVAALFKDADYQGILKRSQEKMWDSYFKSFSSNEHEDYHFKNVFPLYIHE
jgi:hypothetical protein